MFPSKVLVPTANTQATDVLWCWAKLVLEGVGSREELAELERIVAQRRAESEQAVVDEFEPFEE